MYQLPPQYPSYSQYDNNLPPPHPIDCPRCGRPTVVRQGPGKYACLSCSWHRDLNIEHDYRYERLPFWLFAIIVGLVVVLMNQS